MAFSRAFLPALIFLAACYESHSPSERPDVGRDTSVDVPTVDTNVDTGFDAGFDSGFDAGSDTGDEPCSRDNDCASRACVRNTRTPVVDRGLVDLVCGPASAAGDPSGACEESADCPRGLCLVADRCVAPCVNDGDCGENQECRQVTVRGNAQALEEVTACVTTFAAAPSWSVSDQLLPLAGDTAVTIERTSGEQVIVTQTFDVRPTAFVSLETGSGEVISTPGALPSGPNPVSGFGRPHVIMIPMSRRVPVEPTYIANFRPIGEVTAFQRRLEGPRQGPRQIMLELFTFPAVVTVGGDRQIPQRLERILTRVVREIERTLAVTVAGIRVHPVVGQLAQALTVAPMSGFNHPNLIRARQVAVGIDEAAIPIFWMRDIEGVLGTAGGIPGPWGVTGTDTAGIGISADSCVQSGETPNTIAHEIGHYLGLYHTFELDGSRINPLMDTPDCSDMDGDGFVAPFECEESNFMFWSAGRGSTGEQRDLIGSTMLAAYE